LELRYRSAGKVVLLRLLSMTAVWCPEEGKPQDSVVVLEAPVKKQGQSFVIA